MKYLDYNLYQEACKPNGESFEDNWNKQYDKYLQAFEQISHRLPKSFLKEFHKHHMHDNSVKSISITKKNLKTRCLYNLTICLTDYHDDNIEHTMIFTDIRNLKSNLSFIGFIGTCDWIYSEILEINTKMLSLEVLLFEDSTLYFEFAKLHYRRTKVI